MPARLTVSIDRFPIAGTFTIARGSRTEAVVVTATIEEGGAVGRGECVPYARYGETVEGVAAAVEAQAGAVAGGLTREALHGAMPAGASRTARMRSRSPSPPPSLIFRIGRSCALAVASAMASGVPRLIV